jgi:hypothetical protein
VCVCACAGECVNVSMQYDVMLLCWCVSDVRSLCCLCSRFIVNAEISDAKEK